MASTDSRPVILLSNDDGFQSHGINALFEALSEVADVTMVAPALDQSATSHALSLHRPLRHREVAERVHVVDGTPADCVYVGLFHPKILPRRPDAVVSGINHGPNLGSDVHYSGTVAAAREGALRQIRAVAFSLADAVGFDLCVPIAVEMTMRLLDTELPKGPAPLLNVNFPGGTPNGIRATRLGERTYFDDISIREDPRGREYLWLGGPGPNEHPPVDGSDTEAVDSGFVSVTPLRVEVTRPDHFGVAAYVAGPTADDASIAVEER